MKSLNKSAKVTLLASMFLLTCSPSFAATSNDETVASIKPKNYVYIPANTETVRWGNIGVGKPIVTVNSGDIATIETITHHSGDDVERIVKGDKGVEEIFKWTEKEKGIENRGPGVHVMTGPIAIKGAEPGDVLEVKILDASLRPSANPAYAGKTYGINAAANWGYLYNDMLDPSKKREVVTIYEMDATGQQTWAKALYNFQWTPQTDASGKVHSTVDYPGVLVDHSKVQENYNVLKDVRVPTRLHFGTMGVAPKEADVVDSVPPSYSGGNVDDWRVGKGATMYYPVAVKDALFTVGDPHAAMGDAELNGTAIETSMNGTFQFILHKKDKLEKKLQGLDFPLLETANEFVIHGFSYANYLAELGENAQKEVYKKSSIDKAFRDATHKMRWFLMNNMGLTEDEAYSLMSTAVDYGVTQVVDGNWGVHGSIQKSMFKFVE